jgi:cation diffusion facilitator family transporter
MDDKQKIIRSKSITIKGLILNILLSAFKLIAGFIGMSQAMIADGVHSLSDVATDVIVFLGLVFGRKPKDKTHPYGHGKFETIASASVGLALLGMAFKIGYNAIQSLLLKAIREPGLIALVAAVVSIITKEWLYRYTVSFGKKIDSQAMIANAWHHRSDALSSIAVLSGIAAARAGFPIFDPLAAILVCLFILKVSFDIIKLSFMELVETSIDTETIKKIKKIARAQREVISVHGIKARRVGSKITCELHIVLNPQIKLSNAHAIAKKVEKEIISRVKNTDEVLIHVDPQKE